MTEEEHLENLWTMHGVTGSHHLGAGLTDQLAATSLTPDWTTDSTGATSMLDPPLYYDTGVGPNHFTVDSSLRQSYEVHHPFGQHSDDNFHLGEEDPLHPTVTEMDMGDENLEDSPHSEEMEAALNKQGDSNTADTSKNSADSDTEDKDEGSADHEHTGDKTQASKPATNNFVNKLHLMISDPKATGFIWWTELGTRYVY
jgi:hypothetical protein